MYPPSFKDNSKGYIRTKYTGMTCNGVGVILPRRWWTLGSCPCAKQLMCRWSVYFILIVHCLLKSLWFEQLQWCFYVICLYFAWDERHFFIALMQEVEKNGALLSKRQTSFNVSENIFIRQWMNNGIMCQAYVKNRTVCRMMSRRIEIVG